MTICIATDGFPPMTGGIATFYGHLSAMLTKYGHKVIVLMVDHDMKMQDDEIKESGAVTKVLLRKSYTTYKEKYAPYFRPGGLDAPGWIAIGMAMRDWLQQNHKKYSIDVIETTDYGGLGAFLLAEELPPVIITGHGSYTQLKKYNHSLNDSHNNLVTELEMFAFRNADMVIAHSPLNQSDLSVLSGRSI